MADYVPLCNGHVLIAPRDQPSVVTFDVHDNKTVSTWPLQAPGGAVVLDPTRGLLFVAEPALPQLERIDIASGATAAIPLPAPAVTLALGKDGRLFAGLDDAAAAPNRALAVVDGEAGVVDAVMTDKFGLLMVFDRSHDQLITGELGGGPGALRRFAFDAATKTLTLAEERADAGNDCRDLAISPDGKHVAYLCVGGNAGMTGVADFSSADLSTIQGTWQAPGFPSVQTDPRGAAFSPDGQILLVSTGEMYAFFDVGKHEGIEGSLVGGTCWARRGARISPFGKQAYLLDECTYDPASQDLRADSIPSPL